VLFAACAKTVESESKAWESNKTRAQELKGLYPGFSAAIDQMVQSAQSTWDAAAGISKEEDKIAKMAEANALLGSGWMGELSNADSQIRKLRTDANALTSKATDPGDKIAAASMAAQITMTIGRIEQDLRMGASDQVGASAIVHRAHEDLNASQRLVNDMESAFRSKNNASNKVSQDGQSDTKAEQPATWTCAYCAKTNDASAKECPGCGAAKP